MAQSPRRATSRALACAWQSCTMREVVVFLDEPAPRAIARAAAFLRQHGVSLLHQSSHSLSFTGAGAASECPASPARAQDSGTRAASPGTLAADTGQIAAVPVQLRPEWCRVWVTVAGEGAAARAAGAYVDMQQERSRRVEAEVKALERDVYSEARWPDYEASLRASLQQHGADAGAIDAKIATFKQRWLALGRRARAAGPEDGRSA